MFEVFLVFPALLKLNIYILVRITFLLCKSRLFQEPNILYSVQLSLLQQKLFLLLFIKVQLGNEHKT